MGFPEGAYHLARQIGRVLSPQGQVKIKCCKRMLTDPLTDPQYRHYKWTACLRTVNSGELNSGGGTHQVLLLKWGVESAKAAGCPGTVFELSPSTQREECLAQGLRAETKAFAELQHCSDLQVPPWMFTNGGRCPRWCVA